MQVPTQIEFKVSDPNQVSDVFVNGPINLQIGPEVCMITFTKARPDIDKLMHGQTEAAVSAVVAIRLVLPTSVANQLHTMLGQGLSSLTVSTISAAGPNGGAIAPRSKSH
jgi:hypothetical protein